jgi:2-keto-4-pentenoate hydratase
MKGRTQMGDMRWTREDEYQFRLEAIRRDILYGDGPEGRRRAAISRKLREQFPDGSPIEWHMEHEGEDRDG